MRTPQWLHSTCDSICHLVISVHDPRVKNPAMPAAVSIDGVLVPAREARVPVLDRGFLYGDSVYEVIRTYGLEPFELPAHLARLQASADRTALRLPWTPARMDEEIRRVLEASRGPEEEDPDAAPWNQG